MILTDGQKILLTCLVGAGVLTAFITWLLSRTPASGSVIREQGPEHHREKASTPSTGGRGFLFALALTGFPGAMLLTDPRAIIGVAAGLLTGLIGLADDNLKVTRQDSSGLKARYKLPLMIVVGFLAVGATWYLVQDDTLRIPFMQEPIHLGPWKLIIGLLCYLTIINGVNFTDGVDGLAAGTVLIASLFLGVAIFVTGSGSVIVPAVLVGICIGFLPFNWNPAKIFMGDSGALCLGGALAGAAVAASLEIVIFLIGIVFIIEITTVVMQVVYFRLTGGKRIFRMTPIHHAFELRGYREPAIVIGASVIGIAGGLIGLWSVQR